MVAVSWKVVAMVGGGDDEDNDGGGVNCGG